jgi:tight adherence protein C
MLLAFLSFFAAFLLVFSCGLLLFYRETMLERLAHVTARPSESASWLARLLSRRASHMQTLVDPFQRILPRSPQEVSVIQKRLIRAGLRDDYYVNLFYGAKVITPLLLTGLAFVTGLYQVGPLFVFFVTAGLGFLIPDFLLGNRIKSRQTAIRLGLPDALDLLIICLEAGLGIDQALARVCEESRISQPELADEFSLVALEQRAGHTRADAWRNLSERTGLETIRALASILIQADQFGTSMARSLRVHSDSLRTKRRQAAEEQAAKTTVKLVFPLVFFIFPAMFVVVIAPSAIVLAEAFDKYLLN